MVHSSITKLQNEKGYGTRTAFTCVYVRESKTNTAKDVRREVVKR